MNNNLCNVVKNKVIKGSLLSKFTEWCIKRHSDTNHYYDNYLPYSFHLRMVAQVAEDYKHLIPSEDFDIVVAGCFSHDIIEDARTSYNDVMRQGIKIYKNSETAFSIAEIAFLCTDMRGRSRDEKHSDEYFNQLKSNKYAVFVKLCDRIANIQYGKLTKSSMVLKYKNEYSRFKEMLYCKEYGEMFLYIESLIYN